jgi:hypothetical protein
MDDYDEIYNYNGLNYGHMKYLTFFYLLFLWRLKNRVKKNCSD